MTSYAAPAELRTQIDKSGNTGSSSDTNLQILLDAATAAIDQYCGRPDGFTADTSASARVFVGRGQPWLYIPECTAITALAVKDSVSDDDYTAWASDDYIAASGSYENPDYNSTPYTLLIVDPDGTGGYADFTNGYTRGLRGFRPTSTLRAKPTVQVTAKWGYSTTAPASVKQACLIIASRYFKRGESAWADAAASGELGQLMYRQGIDPEAKQLLTRLCKPNLGLGI
jgi:hypothetical protein